MNDDNAMLLRELARLAAEFPHPGDSNFRPTASSVPARADPRIAHAATDSLNGGHNHE